MRKVFPKFTQKPVAMATFALLSSAMPLAANADISVTGGYFNNPGAPVVFGPGNTSAPTTGLYVGNGVPGSFSATAGSQLQLGGLTIGLNGPLNEYGSGAGVITGAGTRVELLGDQGLNIGNGGAGQLTVSAGAVLDGTGSASACLVPNKYCFSQVGSAAGSTGALTVTGAGSAVKLFGNLFVGQPGVMTGGYTLGQLGGHVSSAVNVLDGGLLRTDSANVGLESFGNASVGNETSFSAILINGVGSRWEVTGGSFYDNATNQIKPQGAFLTTGNRPGAAVQMTVNGGGKMVFGNVANGYNNLTLSNGGGVTTLLVSGAGSSIDFNGASLTVARTASSYATASVTSGARFNDLSGLIVGTENGTGTLTIDGAGSVVNLSRNTNGGGTAGGLTIGSSNGTGTVNVSNGGLLEIVNSSTVANKNNFNVVGFNGGLGRLNISGTGSLVTVTTSSLVAGGGSNEIANSGFTFGQNGQGFLDIYDGGKLLVQGGAVSTASSVRGTNVNIGSFQGGLGVASISGLGSELRVTGSDTFIGVGSGQNTSGSLFLSHGAFVGATLMNVGRASTNGTVAFGTMTINNSTVELAGQNTSSSSGAGLNVGSGALGNGTVLLTNGGKLQITNLGTAGAGMAIGGSGGVASGTGSVVLDTGSQIKMTVAANQATSSALNVGRNGGTGLLQVKGASTVDLGGANLHVARDPDSVGTLLVSGGSNVSAGFIGIGRRLTPTGSLDGGNATVIVNDTSKLTGNDIVIGSKGYLGGTGTIVGNITNYGTLNPGNSPGTLVIDGTYVSGLGGKLILEVESDGHGGFNTDHLIFTQGSVVNLSGLGITFSFLGATDPNAFKASGNFDIDNFLKIRTVTGSTTVDVDLAPSAYDGVSFAAESDGYQISNFSYSNNASGANFVAAAVPEPQTYAMLLAGLWMVTMVVRRRREG